MRLTCCFYRVIGLAGAGAAVKAMAKTPRTGSRSLAGSGFSSTLQTGMVENDRGADRRDLLLELQGSRACDYAALDEIEWAVLETSGRFSFIAGQS